MIAKSRFPAFTIEPITANLFSQSVLLGEPVELNDHDQIKSFEALIKEDPRIRVFNDTVPAGLLITRVSDGKTIFSNKAFEEMLGENGERAFGDTWIDFFHDPADRQELMQKFVEDSEVRNHELHLRHADGRSVWGLVSMAAIPIEEEDLLMFALIDITPLKQAEKEIRHLANHDALTGLPSVRLAKDRLDHAIAQARRAQTQTTVMFVDLDGFKAVNDTLGHDAGDAVLKTVAERLKTCTREADTVARIGGDEFIVILDRQGREVATRVAERIVSSVHEPFKMDCGDAKIGASIGIALYPEHGETTAALMKAADDAMYKIKKSGKGAAAFVG